MAVTELIHVILLAIEDLLVWWAGSVGISPWLVIGISLVVFYFFWNQIYTFFKGVIQWVRSILRF